MMAMFMTAMTSVMMAATATWHYEWNTTKQNGGEGFHNFGSSFVDFDELTDDPTIIPEKSGTIHIDHTCRLLLVTAGYNVFSPLVDLQFTIDESTGIRAVDDNQPANGNRLCDLQGRQVSTKHKGKGLYIRNGKKIIVK